MAEPPDDGIDPAPAPDETLAEEEQIVEIKRALAALPARQRAAIVLHYYQELSNADAAAALEVSVEALESLLSRGRRNLRRQLDGSAWNDREASS